MTSDSDDLALLARFCDLAARGRHASASTGERVANRLACVLHELGDDMALLDEDAIRGFYQLAMAAHGPWPTDAAKSTVFTIIRKAAKP